MKRLFPILSILTAILLAYALYQALVVAPTDAQQGDVDIAFGRLNEHAGPAGGLRPSRWPGSGRTRTSA